MALDPSIYGAVGRVKSVQDYDNEAQAAKLNQLQLLAAQSQYAQGQQGIADDNALRAVTRQFGTDAAANRGLIAGTGNYKALTAYDKTQADNLKSQSEIGKNNAQAGHFTAQTGEIDFKQQLARRQQHLQELSGVQDVPGASQWLAQAVASGELPFDRAAAAHAQLQADPQSLAQWKERAQQGGLTLIQQMEQQNKKQEFGLKNANEIMTGDGNGGFVVNQPLVAAKQHVAKAGASNVSVKVDANLGKSVADQVGPMMKESYEGATGAQQQVVTASNLIGAIDSGKAFTGPGANFKLGAAQLAQTLGVGGKDTADQIMNTRAAVQGLAQSTIAARAALKGQGQISDYEGKLLQRAASGDISEMTGPEIRQIAQVNKRLAQMQIDLHTQRVSKLKSNDTTAPLANFYELGSTGNTAPAAPVAPASGFKYIGPAQ